MMKGLYPVVFICLCLSLSGCSQHENNRQYTCEGCNVILISIDTLRADHLGVYGNMRNVSPNIDSLAQQGILFENHYSQAPLTEPSHMSIFTSLYPSEHRICAIGVTDVGCRYTLDENITTLTEVLRRNGYATYGYVNAFNMHSNYGFGRGFDSYENFFGLDEFAAQDDPLGALLPRTSGKPFFLFLHTYTPHDPYYPPQELVNRFCGNYSGRAPSSFKEQYLMMLDMLKETPSSDFSRLFFDSLPSRVQQDSTLHAELRAILGEGYSEQNILRIVDVLRRFSERDVIFEWPRVIDEGSGEMLDYPGEVIDYMREITLPTMVRENRRDLAQLECLYDAEIFQVDTLIGSLFSSLRNHGLWDRTVIIVTSDHGEEFLEHGGLYHILLYDEILRVPLLLWNPRFPRRNVSITDASRSIDIFPTVLDILGIGQEAQLRGTSLVPLLYGRDTNPYPLYSEMLSVRYSAIQPVGGAMYKIYLDDDVWKLYNLDSDPSERENLLGGVPDIEVSLRRLLADHMGVAAAAPGFYEMDEPWLDEQDPWNEERLNELRALGYV